MTVCGLLCLFVQYVHNIYIYMFYSFMCVYFQFYVKHKLWGFEMQTHPVQTQHSSFFLNHRFETCKLFGLCDFFVNVLSRCTDTSLASKEFEAITLNQMLLERAFSFA